MPKLVFYPQGSTLETAQAVTIPTCPGCGHGHFMPIRSEQRPVWHFNGDLDRPTLKPSILSKTGPFPPDVKKEYIINGTPSQLNADRCLVYHFFLTDGRVQFLTDCTHAQKGKTVELPELDDPAAGA